MTVSTARTMRAPIETQETSREPHLTLCATRRSGIVAHLDVLKEHCMRFRYHRNETIVSEQESAAHIYRVVGGTVRICRHVADGRRHISDFLFAGDVFGLGRFNDFPYSAEAVNSVTVVAYPRIAFDHLAEGNAELGTALLAHFSALLSRAQEHVFMASCQSARERTASFILKMQQQDQVVYGDRVDLPMGRQEIADHLGLTIETICRALASLRDAGTIEIPNAHQLVVKRPDELRAIVEGKSTQ